MDKVFLKNHFMKKHLLQETLNIEVLPKSKCETREKTEAKTIAVTLEVGQFEWEDPIQHGLNESGKHQDNCSVGDVNPEVSKVNWKDSVNVTLSKNEQKV